LSINTYTKKESNKHLKINNEKGYKKVAVLISVGIKEDKKHILSVK